MRRVCLMAVLLFAARFAAAQDTQAEAPPAEAGAEVEQAPAPAAEREPVAGTEKKAEGKVESATKTGSKADDEIPEDFKPTEQISEDLSTALPADI